MTIWEDFLDQFRHCLRSPQPISTKSKSWSPSILVWITRKVWSERFDGLHPISMILAKKKRIDLESPFLDGTEDRTRLSSKVLDIDSSSKFFSIVWCWKNAFCPFTEVAIFYIGGHPHIKCRNPIFQFQLEINLKIESQIVYMLRHRVSSSKGLVVIIDLVTSQDYHRISLTLTRLRKAHGLRCWRIVQASSCPWGHVTTVYSFLPHRSFGESLMFLISNNNPKPFLAIWLE